MGRTWIRDPLAVLLPDGVDGDAGIVLADGVIAETLPRGVRPATPVDEVVDASRKVLLPGLVNTHHHFFQTLTRAWAPVASVGLFDWLTRLYEVWQHLAPADLVIATQTALVELLMSGCTTTSDHHYLFPAGLEEAIDIQVEQALALGIRVHLTRGSMTRGRDDGGLPPQAVIQDPEVIMDDSRRLVARYHDPRPGAMVRIALAPCAPFTVTRQTMRDAAALAEDLDVRLHTHLAETLVEERFLLDTYGCRTVDYLESVGWLGERTWLAHGIHFDDAEITRLGAAGVGVTYCPASNMRLGSGTCRVPELEAAGAPVGLGVDGSASNDASSLIADVRVALLQQRLRYGAAAVTPERALGWATAGSARVLGRDDIGVIEVGRVADLALFDLDDLRYAGAHDPLAALVLCGAERASDVMVAGTWRVRDGEVLGVDVPRLAARQREAAAALVRRA